MKFDFYNEYKRYSNIELLKIIKRPDDYQADAVIIATQILNERQLSAEEIQLVDDFYNNIDDGIKVRKEKVDAYKDKAADLLGPILHPSEKFEPHKWVNILLLIIALQYSWSAFNIIKRMIRIARCTYCELDIVAYVDIFTLLYIPLIFFLLYKRKRWGWILLFADNLVTFILAIGEAFIYFSSQHIHYFDTSSFRWSVFINGAVAVFLWRKSISDLFGVSDETKKITALVVAVPAIVFIIYSYLRLS